MDECSQSGITSGVYCLDGFIFNLLRHYFVFTLGLKVKSSFSSRDTLSLHPGVHSARENHEILFLKNRNLIFYLFCHAIHWPFSGIQTKILFIFFLLLNPPCCNFPFPVHCCGCRSLFWTQFLIPRWAGPRWSKVQCQQFQKLLDNSLGQQ